MCDISVKDFKELIKNYKIIRNEIESYNPLVFKKKEIILLSKCDLINEKSINERIELLKELTPSKIIAVSSYSNVGMQKLKSSLEELI